MNAIPGPRKLILIDSGVYPYAEIDLEESVHLSGPNNAGKTTLLNALQFLYIDNIQAMHFGSHDFHRKTKPFYFKPAGRSTILMEADTKWGVRTVGFHGLGSIAGCDWQRFGFEGPYVKDDWIDPETGQARAWDDVKARLADRNYVQLTQAQLRDALRGNAKGGGFRLEFVPSGGSYDTFIEVFRQLLTLRKSRPDDLKRLLISVVEQELESGTERNRGVVSLGATLGDQYVKATQSKAQYERVLASERAAQHLFVEVEQLEARQAELPGLLTEARLEAGARARLARQQGEEATSAAEEAAEEARVWDQKRRDLDKEAKGLAQEMGRLQSQLDRVLEAEAGLAAEPKALKEGRLEDVRREIQEVMGDLAVTQSAGAADSSTALRQRIATLRKDREATLAHVERLKRLDESGDKPEWMSILEDYPEAERGPLLKLVNPALFLLPEGEEGVEVTHPERLGRLLSGVALATHGGTFEAAGVRIALGALPAPDVAFDDPVARLREIERFEARIAHLDQDIARLEKLAGDVHARETLGRSLEALRKEEHALTRDLYQVEAWEKILQDRPDLEGRLQGLETREQRLGEQREQALEHHEASQTRHRVELARARERMAECEQLEQRTLRTLDQYAFALSLDIADDRYASRMDLADFRALEARVEEVWREAMALDQTVTRALESLDERLGGMLGGDRAERLAQLRELIDGLVDQKALLDATWKHIAVTSRTAFTHLLRDYEKVLSRAHKLNRQMAKFSVSNLTGVQLRLLEQSHTMEVLRQFTQEEGLFQDLEMTDKAREQVGKWIEEGQIFRLEDLFRVELEVNKDGEKEIYASLEAESTGTAVTLKVIFLAHLLRDLYRTRSEVRLIIFVDEVDTLDDVNQETIRLCARQLGFILIMASPNPANAKRLYFLRPEGKVTYIHPEEALEVVFRDEGDGDFEDVAEEALAGDGA